MKLVREGVFETNSSSTHSLTICTKKLYQDWLDGKAFYVPDKSKILEGEELDRYLKEQVILSRYEYVNSGEYSYYYKGVGYNNRRDMLTEENLAEITAVDIKDYLNEYSDDYCDRPVTKEEYDDVVTEEYEKFKEEIITEHGDEIVVFGYHGSNY